MEAMAPLVSTVEIASAPGDVFAYATDPSRFAEWQADVVDVRVDGPASLPKGTLFTTTRRISGTERTMTQEITEHETPRRWAARGVDGPVRPTATITVEPLDGGTRSRVTFTLDFEGHGIGVALMPLVRRQAAKAAPMSYRTLKERLEAGG
jgi:uncharacterized protein YndB with AHSA1/START domain